MIGRNFIPSRREGEEVVGHFWQHPMIFISIVVFFLFLFIIPISVYWIMFTVLPAVLDSPTILPLLTIFCFSYYLLILVFSLNVWVDNYLDVWTLTNMRIISRDQLGLFNRVTSELELINVQDVTVEQKGILHTLLNYGDIYVQTAGTVERFTFKNVSNPVRVARLIQSINEEVKRNYGGPIPPAGQVTPINPFGVNPPPV